MHPEELVRKHIPEHAYAERWDAAGLKEQTQHALLNLDLPIEDWVQGREASAKTISANA